MPTHSDVSSPFPGISEMAALMRGFDWESVGLPSADRWPSSLKAVTRILLTSRYAMWMGWGPELRFLYNDAYAAMTLGEKHPWALGRPFREVWAEIWDALSARIDVVMRGEATWDEGLLLILERSGYPEETYHTFSYSPIIDDDGAIAGLFCVVAEETERVIGERRLAALRDLASGLAATAIEEDVFQAVGKSLANAAKDLPFTLTYIFETVGDRQIARLHSSTGIGDHALAPPRFDIDSPGAPWPAAELAANPRAIIVSDLERRIGSLPPGGGWSEPPLAAAVVPIAAQGSDRAAGMFVAGLNRFRPYDTGYAGFVDLIAGQIGASLANARAYEAERRRAESLAELDRAKTTFFSNVSHEFRTPLALMLGPAADLLSDAQLSPTNRDQVSVVHRNALRLLKLVNTMLEFSRLEAGRVTAHFEESDFGEFTAELASSFRSAVERAGLQLIVTNEPPPPGSPDVYLDCDMWERVVLNLLSNAFKHTFAGKIEVITRVYGEHAILEVRDTGVGIPAEQLPHIFERFHRVPNAKSRTHEGTGIGLALVQELVRVHGGRMTVESEPGKGTTFTVGLPIGSAHLNADQIAPPKSGKRAAPGSTAFVEEALRWLPSGARAPDGVTAVDSGDTGTSPTVRGRVLVADDNADMREYVARLIRGRGHDAISVADGTAALELAQTLLPDVVLSDVMMPGRDGFEVVRALQRNPETAAIPVVLLSARAGDEARVEGLESGAADYLVKPFSARELIARVEAQIERSVRGTLERRAMRERDNLLTAAQTERARLRELFEQAPAAIAIINGPDLIYDLANPEYEKLINFRNAVGRSIKDVLPELATQGTFELLEDVMRTGTPYVGRGYALKMADEPGGPLLDRYFNFVYQPIRESDKGVTGVFVHAVDVTQQMHAVRDAEDANRAKSEFLAAMSHELRTPLNAIGGYAQLMEMGIHGPLTEAQRDALVRLRRSEHHLLALVNDVLNFAKLEAGRVEYDIRRVRVADVIDDVRAIIEPQFASRGLHFVISLDDDPHVLGDAEKIHQILINLLSNAGKFTDSGGRITLSTAVHADGIAISVADTGIGIPAEKRASIFDPFVQVHRNLKQNVEGTGLGLAISRDLAHGMNGNLTVSSSEGKGSTFTLTLPSA